MRKSHYKYLWWSVLLFSFFSVSYALSETNQGEVESRQRKPIEISSNSLEVDNFQKIVTFYGDVQAKMDKFDVECEKILLHYEVSPPLKQEVEKEGKPKINKIVATGQVVIHRGQDGTATAEKAMYFQQDEKLILTGKPVVLQQDDNKTEGDKVTLFLTEDRMIVESSEDTRVKARIFSHDDFR